MKNASQLALLLSLLASCQIEKEARNIEAFYFPLQSLKDGKVYEYQSVGNPNDPPVYWLYHSEKADGEEFLLGTAYSPEFLPDQSIREKRVDNGMKLTEFSTWETDSTGERRQVQASIQAGNVFPFLVKENPGVLLTSLRWQSSQADSATLSLVRNRQFDKDTTVIFQGEKTAAVKFQVRYLVDQEIEGHLELEYGGEEVYAKGIGLVFFKKDINKDWKMAYELAAIYDLKAFEEKFKTKLER